MSKRVGGIYYNKEFFSHINLLNSYWAGFIAADGCVQPERNSVKIALAERDGYHLKFLQKAVDYTGTIKYYNYRQDRKCATILFCGAQQWISDLDKNFGIGPRKSLTIEPPDLYQSNALAFITGLFDGDGFKTLTNRKYTTWGLLGTEAMLLWVQSFIDQQVPLLPKKKFSTPRKHKTIYQLQVVGERAERLFGLLDSLDVPRINRKLLCLK